MWNKSRYLDISTVLNNKIVSWGKYVFTKWKIGMITSLLAFTTFTSVISAEEKPKDQPKWDEWIKENVQKLNEPNAQTNEDLSF